MHRQSRVFITLAGEGCAAWVRRLSIFLILALVATMADVPTRPAPPAAAAAAPTPAPKPKCPDDRADEVSAAIAAKLCASRVEVKNRRTETTQVFANPDGTLTEEQALAPVRVRRGDQWVPVDLTLQRRSDGSVAPIAHPLALTFAGATPGTGEHEVVKIGEGADQAGLAWSGALPEPVLDGRTITYPDVRPGVDLVFHAHATGYEQHFVVKDRAALAQVRKLSVPLRTGQLTAATDGMGGLLLKDRRGRQVGRAQTPLMWDAEVAPQSGERLNHARVALRAVAAGKGRTVMELTPDATFLARPDLTFPVTIDPPTSLSPSFDAFVQNTYSSDQSGSADLKLGYSNDGGSFTARSYLRFNTSGFAGSRVISAKLRLWNYHSWSCTAASWEAWRTDLVDSSVRWTAQPTARAKVGTSTETRGYSSSCGDGYVYVEVGGALQYAADTSASSASVMLRATSETSTSGWKRFDSAEGTHPPLVSITYNSAPSVPSALAAAPCYTACGSGAQTSSLRPTLSAKLTDANAGQTLQAEFVVRNKTTQAVVSSSGLRSGSPAWTNGSTASWQVPVDLVNGVQYEWQVRAKDPYAYGTATAWTPLTVDTTKPGVPFVAATIYLNDAQPHGGAGQADTFTFTPASGSTDLAAFVYKFDYDTAATTVAATGAKSVTLSPRDGHRTLSVQAKDSAGNLSDLNQYVFDAGNAALAEPLPGATIVKRTKLRITTPVSGYTRTYFEYRRGPGGAILPVPSANLTSATGAPITATSASPVGLSALGGYAIWNATDTLGLTGGVVEVRAHLYTATGTTPAYTIPWVRVSVDSSGDGAADDEIGAGSVNLLTGDYSISSTDADELGLSVARATSSRDGAAGYQPMAQRLTANQQQISTDLTGFTVPSTSSAARSTARGQGETSPADSLEITPVTTTSNDTYVAVGGDGGAMRLNMAAGRTYRMTGWIFVPGATGLVPAYAQRGLRIVGLTKTGSTYTETSSAMAAYTDGWQELSLDMTVPAGASEAFFRLYNGMQGGSGRKVYWDNLSFTEIIAPFGPAWTGGATGGAADIEYSTVTLPEPSLARVNGIGGGWITFAKNTDGVTFTPEPGSEGMVLTKVGTTAYRLSELDGTVTEFTSQGGVWAATSSWTPESDTTSRYIYDTTGSRLLLKKVINPAEPGVDDTNHCTTAVPARGCEVLEYEYATTTSSGLSQTVFGDYTDRVSGVKLWAWDPDTSATTATQVTRYAYDDLGQLREVWDPRATPALKTTYEYGGGRVTKVTPSGELPWNFDYGNPDVDSAALRWDLDAGSGTAVADSSGSGRNGTMASGVSWGQGNDPDNPADRASVFTGGTGQQISVAGTALSNTASYTVSAWVRIKDKSVNRTAVSKDGSRTSGLFLNYVAAEDKFAFSRVTSDSDSATPVRAIANSTAVAGKWTHLTGVYDTASAKMKLYVNGVLQSTTAATGGWNAGGAYVIGRAKWAGAASNIWDGEVDDVRVYGKALTDQQVTRLSGDENTGRLLKVRRAALQQGSKTATDGEVATNVVYNVPLARSLGGPYDLNSAAISTWGQVDLPTDATAVFGPEDNPGRNAATPASPGSNGYPYATVHYLNAGGQEVNTASPGGHLDTAEYDRFGNVVRSLEATDRELALGTFQGSARYLDELGLAGSDTASRALALSTINTYSTDGVDLLESVGPTSTVVLENPLADPDGTGPLEAIPAGATVIGRSHAVNKYDEGKPDGATYHLVTTESEGAQIVGYPDADVRVSKNAYDAEYGGVSGWTLKSPTKVIADAGAGGQNLTAYVVRNASGQVLKSWGIGSTGSDAMATEVIYYSTGANAQDGACGNRPEWAGEPCVTRAVGAVTGHDPARMTTNLPVRRINSYTRYGDEAVVSETSNGKTRTTTTQYDAATRVISTQVSSDEGAPVPAVTTAYSPTSGDVTVTTMGTSTVTREYDLLGRLASYTDADGGTTTNEFDRFGKSVKVSDPTGYSTFAYDRAAEPRGLLTSVTDSVAGTFSAKYSPDGQLTELKYPGGLTRTDRLDANLQPVERTYTRDSDNEVIYSESVQENTAGQWVNHTYTGGSKAYRYDRLGRLTRAQHDSAITDGCVTRTYTYDDRTNRTGNSRYAPAADGTCDETGTPVSGTHSYDTADRLTDAGYVYDAFGRTTTMPDGLTNAYFANDLVQRQQLGDSRQSWTLDPAHRFRAFTTETMVDGNWVNATSKLNHYGDDSDEPRWIIEDTTLGSYTRNVSGPDGDLAATTSDAGDVRLQLLNLHGDVAATIDTALLEPEFLDYDEFGVPVAGQADQRYGWLGGKQRSGDAVGDVILMGVRLYSPGIGRFLQVDPVDGGNATAYDYCAGDPVNCTDLDGKFGWGSIKKGLSKVAKVASYASMIPGPIGTIAGVVSAVSYAATGNWREAAWAIGGALAATVGAGAAVRGARFAVGAARAAQKARKASRARRLYKGRHRSRCNSFTPQTQVLMADGSSLPISDVQLGDWVMAVDPTTGVAEAKPVLAVIDGVGAKHLIDIDLDEGQGGALEATAEHPLWVEGVGWTFAEKVRAGDRLRAANGTTVQVASVVDRGWVPAQTVYNLNVGDVHTYAVRVDGVDVLAHNVSACGKHGNSLDCSCPHYVYRIDKNGEVYRYGEGKGDRLPKQLRKLNRKNPNDKYTAKYLRRGIPGKRRAKAIETRLIRGFFRIFGKRPDGNKNWH
ncbi:LamG-like jellyroll fold domain-containing protein [Micromonospora sp. CA-248212]|uniref:LamG-like jellyroll fold domain-containing protein n=1 Tax=Micromonospora sp. CA-248212 TaxID=3239961 RepID=UPI003D944F4C